MQKIPLYPSSIPGLTPEYYIAFSYCAPITLLGVYLKESKTLIQNYECTLSVHSSFTYNCQDMEAT